MSIFHLSFKIPVYIKSSTKLENLSSEKRFIKKFYFELICHIHVPPKRSGPLLVMKKINENRQRKPKKKGNNCMRRNRRQDGCLAQGVSRCSRCSNEMLEKRVWFRNIIYCVWMYRN